MTVASLKINPSFHALLPAQTQLEKAELEKLILAEGCRDALVTWRGFIADGHNRYDICTRHGKSFDTRELDAASEEEVKIWIIRTQLARRRLTDVDRARIALQWEPQLAEEARKRQREHGGTAPGKPSKTPVPNGEQVIPSESPVPNPRTIVTLAKIAGVSKRTVEETKFFDANANDAEKAEQKDGKFSDGKKWKLGKAVKLLKERLKRERTLDQPEAAAPPSKANPKPYKRIFDHAQKHWAKAKLHLDKIQPCDFSREKVLKEIVIYCQKRLAVQK